MKVRSAIKTMCKDCYIVNRGKNRYVYCKKHAKHKQRQGFHTSSCNGQALCLCGVIPEVGDMASYLATSPSVAATTTTTAPTFASVTSTGATLSRVTNSTLSPSYLSTVFTTAVAGGNVGNVGTSTSPLEACKPIEDNTISSTSNVVDD